ncbi:MAG: ubiquinol oxidase subunit II [Pseudomonadota bacterium]
MTRRRAWLIALLAPLLAGCDLVVMSPSGDIAAQQADLIVYSTILMLIVIIPVIGLTLYFGYHYRASNEKANYSPDWDHSISLEIVVWAVPLAIITCLAGLTWVATHRLEPYNPIARIKQHVPVPADAKPLVIQAVSMDWKWVFIYPEEGIATVNEVAAVVDRPIEFQLTSVSVMNSLYIPALAGMIYAMPGMQTELNAVINERGTYRGFSANYSGAGFSKMRFKFLGKNDEGFDAWVNKVREKGGDLDLKTLAKLEEQTVDHPVTYFKIAEDKLWDRLVNNCVTPDKLCKHDLMVVDALGGGGLEGLWNRQLYKDMCTLTGKRDLKYLLPMKGRERTLALLEALQTSQPVADAAPLVGTGAATSTTN